MITRFIIAGLLFVTLSSGLSYAFDDEAAVSAEPAVEEPAPGEQPPADQAPVDTPAPAP